VLVTRSAKKKEVNKVWKEAVANDEKGLGFDPDSTVGSVDTPPMWQDLLLVAMKAGMSELGNDTKKFTKPQTKDKR